MKTLLKKAASHVVPIKHNAFVPHILKDWSVWMVLIVSGGLFLFSQVSNVTGKFGLTALVYPTVVVQLTNEVRAEEGFPPLTVNPTLEAAAKLKAEDMAKYGYFAHTSPRGVTPWYWFREAGYTFMHAGENLAVHFTESADVQEAWLNSPTHRANILNGKFTEIGIATTQGTYQGYPTTFVVELFGTPAVKKQTVAVQETQPPVVALSPIPEPEVAGESVTVIEETETFMAFTSTDSTLELAQATPGKPQKISLPQRLLLRSNELIGMIFQAAIILLLFATGGMVLREYEKHHKKHMAYGVLLMVVLGSMLYVGKLGVFNTEKVAVTPVQFIEK